ncbi:FHA domain protein [Humitalea rosea]|uniref:FHA domain protein n=1 Tax=Humitalea rosea TaxID=990373 RepID=A0A2W7JEV7_9PROT|nr:type VI secretion system-associated FHA domain protein TagH [Humitalea rosea]PZW50997.1 FHA domain protein [Humitalea rosea]
MVLVLSVLRCPDRAVPEQRRLPGGEMTLGRGAECDWPLLDPDRVLSKRHCTVEYLSGGWQVRDLSTNGTFLNGAGEPVGRDRVKPLQDGDRLRLGAYEIECRIEQEAGQGAGAWSSAGPDPMADAPSSDIFSASLPGLSPAGGTPGGGAPLLPADFDPFAPEDHGPVMPDHQPSTHDIFAPPRATMPDLLPDDWDAPVAPRPKAADPFAGLPDPFADLPPEAAPARPSPAPAFPPAPRANPMPDPLGDPFADLPPAPKAPPVAPPIAPLVARPVAAPPPAPPPPTAPPAFAADPFAADSFATVPPPMAPPTAPVSAAPAAAPGGLAEALALLHAAAGLPPPLPGTDPTAALTAAGAALRASVGGLRALLIARADVKREFRIEQTMLRAAGNNPVKFAATEEAAVQALLAPRGAGPAAIRETVDDLTAHQVATLAATQAAARALLTRLAPTGVEAEVQGGGIMPGAREKRLWEAYRKLHQQVADQFEDDFDSAFGKAFARAYEEASRR